MKKQSGKDKYPGKICIVVAERSLPKALMALTKANQMADLIELRLDYLAQRNLETLWPRIKKPFIVTNRISKEGGKFMGSEEERISSLLRAIELGAPYIDIEIATPAKYIYHLLEKRKEAKIILSFHDFKKTGPLKGLQSLLDRMIEFEVDIAKIVTLAQSWADNLSILNLIAYARQRKQKIVAFCMGEKGKISRLLSPLMGGEWTYIALQPAKKSAPGQLTINELEEVWRKLA